MSAFILASLLLASAVAASPTAGGVMADVEGRSATSLDGKWAVIVDPYESGYYDFRYQPRSDGYFKDKKPRDARELVEYDFDASGTLDVPGDWNSQRESLFFYEGTVWYRRLFDYRKRDATRVFLYFGAVNYHALVYLNGEKLGEHVGGFTPFQLEITDRVRTGANSLVLKVDNRRYRDAVPTLLTDWWNYGGITRRVRLVEVPAIFIEDYFLQLAKGSHDQVSGWVRLNGAAHPQQVKIEIPEAGVDVRVTTDASGVAAISFRGRLDLWSPERPRIYDVRLSSATDAVSERIGFRSIEVEGDQILLNGKPIFLRGVSIHEEAPMRAGRAWSQEDARTLLGWAQEMGANFVRLAHYPHEEWMAREADRMGLLV
jgi:beta-glucuronidase